MVQTIEELRLEALDEIYKLSYDMDKDLRDIETDRIFQNYLKKLEANCMNMSLYEDDKNKKQQEHFWEVYLANYLTENEIPLQRKIGDAQPDFFFMYGNKKINIEAKTPNNGTLPKNFIKEIPEIDIDDPNHSFEAGTMNPHNSILRFAGTIEASEEQYKKRLNNHKTILADDYNVLAINGNLAVGNVEYHDNNLGKFEISSPGFSMFCSLFNYTGDMVIQISGDKSEMKPTRGPLIKDDTEIKLDFFHRDDFPFDGILYSNIGRKNYVNNNTPVIYYQNPNGRDLREIFKFVDLII